MWAGVAVWCLRGQSARPGFASLSSSWPICLHHFRSSWGNPAYPQKAESWGFYNSPGRVPDVPRGEKKVRALLVQELGLDRARSQDGVAGGWGSSETGAVVQAGGWGSDWQEPMGLGP